MHKGTINCYIVSPEEIQTSDLLRILHHNTDRIPWPLQNFGIVHQTMVWNVKLYGLFYAFYW